MARFSMASRRAGKVNQLARAKAAAAFDSALADLAARPVQIGGVIGQATGTSPRMAWFDAEANEIDSIRRDLHPDVILEPEILYTRAVDSKHEPSEGKDEPSPPLTRDETITVSIWTKRPEERPLPGARAVLYLDDAYGNPAGRVIVDTDDAGTAQLGRLEGGLASGRDTSNPAHDLEFGHCGVCAVR